MKPRLLQFLVCISCKALLSLTTESREGEEIITGMLHCTRCDSRFPITNGIPRFLPSAIPSHIQATSEGFGYEWTHFSELRNEYREQFLDWVHPLTPDDFKGKLVLDAGCGKGRHIYWASQFGAREVIGMDISRAVEAAYANTRRLPNVHIVQADIHHLPFAARTFDLAHSIGVLHHLPDPRRGFSALLPLIKRGGSITIWVYGRENNGWIVRIVNPLRSMVTSRLPLPFVRIIAAIITVPLYITLQLVYRPLARYAPALSRHLFYHAYLTYISRFPFREVYSIVFDHLLAPTAFYLTRQEIEQWFNDSHLSHPIISWHNQNSWRAIVTIK